MSNANTDVLYINQGVPGAREFYPLNKPAIGTPLDATADVPWLFKPLTLRDVTFKNRIWVSAMCQYSSQDGHATDWHLVHIGGYVTGGAGAVCIEATAVLPEGRVSPEDMGLWKDSQIEPLKRIVSFAHAHDSKIGIQLGHAGRKASTLALWMLRNPNRSVALEEEGGWPNEVYGPSDIPFQKGVYPDPKEMTEDKINETIDAFAQAAIRADKAGFDFIELHAAHGYLLHEFLSPLSNTRTDIYGGQSLENRLRVLLQIIEQVKKVWPSHKPLFVRISATDWAEGPEKDADGKWLQWGIEQSTILSKKMMELGVDFVDVSTGGNWAKQNIPWADPNYQVQFADAIKKAIPSLSIGAVGNISEPEQAENIVKEGKADAVFIAREFLRNPNWALYAAQKLGVKVKSPNQYAYGWPAPAAEPRK